MGDGVLYQGPSSSTYGATKSRLRWAGTLANAIHIKHVEPGRRQLALEHIKPRIQ